MSDQQPQNPARNGRHGGAGSNQRRAKRRSLNRVATERQEAWTRRSVGLDGRSRAPFRSHIQQLTTELDEIYAVRRQPARVYRPEED